ncbi:MAG TPA: 5-deoxy-glucuronate isomerase, partial [Terriglobales bacterium]|nr:5-deoxy-glucuronate isomerase [Terriglobales bacterium]
MQRLIKAQSGDPSTFQRQVVPPGAMRFLDFSLLTLPGGRAYHASTAGREALLYVFSGIADVSLQGRDFQQDFAGVGGRSDVFSGPPCVLFIPPQCGYEIKAASSGFHAGLFSAPATQPHAPVLVGSGAIQGKQVGQGSFQRTVYTAVGESLPAERLLAGETMNAPGAWS